MTENILENPNLMDLVLKQTESQGVIGNEKVKKHVLLACVSTYNANPDYTLNLILQQETGIGKSTLAKSVLNLFPEDRVKIISQLSEKALNHMEEPLDRKIIFIDEISGNDASYAMKIAMSEHLLNSSIVEKEEGRYKTKNKQVSTVGTSFITTTTKQAFDNELEGRVLRVYPENSDDYKIKVLDSITGNLRNAQRAQPEQGAGLEDFKKALSQLEILQVEIPFVDEIIKSRRFMDIPNTFRKAKILGAEIQAHTLLYQKQREKRDGTLIAQPEDYNSIRDLLEDIVNPPDPQLIQLKEQVGEREFNVSDIKEIFGVGQTQAYKILRGLKDRGLITGTSDGKYKVRTIVFPEIQISPSNPPILQSSEYPVKVEGPPTDSTHFAGSEDTNNTDSNMDKKLIADFEKFKLCLDGRRFIANNIIMCLELDNQDAVKFIDELARKGLVSATGICDIYEINNP